jgi:membrane-bound lytic murein transglycosylase D
MAPKDTLKLGRKLVIWNSRKVAATQVSSISFKSVQSRIRQLRYTVRKGDSIARIADKFKVRIADIKKWNRIGKYIQPGQKIKLWVDVTTQSS